jgi:hypothetical protein
LRKDREKKRNNKQKVIDIFKKGNDIAVIP